MTEGASVAGDIEVLKAVEAIRRLEARYADEKRWADLAGLFTVDGTVTPQDADGKPLAVMSGWQPGVDGGNDSRPTRR